MKLVDRVWRSGWPREARSGESIAEASRIGEISRASNILLFAIAGVLRGAWSRGPRVAEIDTVAQASGKVVPSARVQLMQSLEGGLVTRHPRRRPATRWKPARLLVIAEPDAGRGRLPDRASSRRWRWARASARLRAEAEGLKPVFAPELHEVRRRIRQGRAGRLRRPPAPSSYR